MISVEGATFTYPGAPAPILRDVSFTVPESSLLAERGGEDHAAAHDDRPAKVGSGAHPR